MSALKFSRLPSGYHPEYCNPKDCAPESFCNGDVLYEGSPPGCMEVEWCWEQGEKLANPYLAKPKDFEDCGTAHNVPWEEEK